MCRKPSSIPSPSRAWSSRAGTSPSRCRGRTMPAIEAVSIRTILDSRGNPTVEVDLRAAGHGGRAAAPSGASTGTHEVPAFPKGGVEEAIRIFRSDVTPRVMGRETGDQAGLDRLLHEIDGTPNFSRIGGEGGGPGPRDPGVPRRVPGPLCREERLRERAGPSAGRAGPHREAPGRTPGPWGRGGLGRETVRRGRPRHRGRRMPCGRVRGRLPRAARDGPRGLRVLPGREVPLPGPRPDDGRAARVPRAAPLAPPCGEPPS